MVNQNVRIQDTLRQQVPFACSTAWNVNSAGECGSGCTVALAERGENRLLCNREHAASATATPCRPVKRNRRHRSILLPRRPQLLGYLALQLVELAQLGVFRG